MNEKNKPKSESATAIGAPTNEAEKLIVDLSYLNDFESWLDLELEKLEAAHSEFATTKSNRVFFKR